MDDDTYKQEPLPPVEFRSEQQHAAPGTYAYNKPYQQKYRRSEKGKATESAYNKTPERKAALNERGRAYRASEKGREANERRQAKRRANWKLFGRQSAQPPKEDVEESDTMLPPHWYYKKRWGR